MITFNKQYYKDNLPNRAHSHYTARAQWIRKNMTSGRVVIPGAGFGWEVYHLRAWEMDVVGIEQSSYACEQSLATLENLNAKDFDFFEDDNIFSWNFLDCLKSAWEAKSVAERMNVTKRQIHILCCDNKDPDSANYRSLGYFVKPMEYWINLLPNAKLVDHHTGRVSDGSVLGIPLSWKFISE